MAEEKSDKTEKPSEKPAEKKAKGGKGKMIIILSVVGVLALGGGGFAYYKFMGPGAKAAEGADGHGAEGGDAAHEAAGTGVVNFEPFVANLADPGGGRFARVNVKIIVHDEAEAKHIEEQPASIARIRAAVLDLLSAEISEHLVTPAGKAELRKKISEKAAEILKPVKVSDVLFSDFVVQF